MIRFNILHLMNHRDLSHRILRFFSRVTVRLITPALPFPKLKETGGPHAIYAISLEPMMAVQHQWRATFTISCGFDLRNFTFKLKKEMFSTRYFTVSNTNYKTHLQIKQLLIIITLERLAV